MSSPGSTTEQNVFLNVPFDKGYERLFVALIAALSAIGRKPRCVLELPEKGEGRLLRIQKHLERCRVSIHDLSRVGLPARFNMPFELGLACGISRYKGRHDVILLEKVPYRLDKTLSDVKGRDPFIHKGSPRLLIHCILDALGTRTRNPDPRVVRRIFTTSWRTAGELKSIYHADSVFSRSVFEALVFAGTEMAIRAGAIRA